ncbi:MAG TPA: PAS domain S-box protein, partial [bacterium]|nr:PAS domain S-box protein [bacterium]
MGNSSRPSSSLVRLASQLGDEVEQLRASLAAAQAEAQEIRTLAAQVRQAVLLHDGSQLIYANPALCALFGYESLAEVSGLSFPESFVMESDREPTLQFWRQALASTGAPQHHEFQGRRKDGQPVWVQIIAQAVTLRGKPALLGVCHEVAARKAAEHAMRIAQERFKSLMDISSDSIWELGPDLRFTLYVPSRTLREYGLQNDPVGRMPEEVIAPDADYAFREKYCADLKARRPIRDCLCPYLDGHGRKRFARVNAHPLFDEAGQFAGYRGISQDVTLEIEALEQARLAHARLMDAIESLPAAFCLYDAERKLLLCNSKVRDFFPGTEEAFVPGASFESILRACAHLMKGA